MSRKKKKQFRDFESSAILEDFKEPYVCITKSMLTSEKWVKLNPTSRYLYSLMKIWSYGKDEFEFSYSLAYNYIKSKGTIKRCVEDLVKNGFLEVTRVSRRPGIGSYYKFTNKWYKN